MGMRVPFRGYGRKPETCTGRFIHKGITLSKLNMILRVKQLGSRQVADFFWETGDPCA